MTDEQEQYANPASMTQDEYVKLRFINMPKRVKEYLILEDDDARANLEILFRAEYYRIRAEVLETLVGKLYPNFLAAKAVIRRVFNDDDQIEKWWNEALEEKGEFKAIPVEFGWKTKKELKDE